MTAPTVVIAVIGQPGGGKSEVARRLADRGATLLDADRMAKAQLAEPEVLAALREAFGDGILQPNGEVDRQALADAVFGVPEKLATLNGIIHPRVRAAFARKLQAAHTADPPPPAVVLDVPLPDKRWLGPLCQAIVFVKTPRADRLERVRERGWTDEELARREQHQLTAAQLEEMATHIIPNDADLKTLDRRVQEFWDRVVAD